MWLWVPLVGQSQEHFFLVQCDEPQCEHVGAKKQHLAPVQIKHPHPTSLEEAWMLRAG